jgi:thymidylate synthase
MSGDPQHDVIAKYAPFWKQIAADDGTVNSNYGYRLLGYAPTTLIPYNQWNNVKSILTQDPDTRQAMMHINLPYDYTRATKDVPCTLNLQWFIRENKLVLIVTMRSNDIILGFCNDVFQFTMLQEMMLCDLRQDPKFDKLELGEYIHESHSMHLYETHFAMAESMKSAEDTKALGVVMHKMVYNDEVKEMLINYERCWRMYYACDPVMCRAPADYGKLPVYWQKLIDVCFGGESIKKLLSHQ